MTEFQIASAIEKMVTSHEGVTDFPVTYAQIEDEVDTLRIRTLAEQDKANLLVMPYNLISQRINFEQQHIKKTAAGKIYVDCPRIFTHATGRLAVAYVGSTTMEKQYRFVFGRQIKNARAVQYMDGEPIAHYYDGKIWLENIGPNRFILDAIFERPRDLEIYGYNPETTEYPLSNGSIDLIIGKTAESYIRQLYRVRPQANQTVDLPPGNA
jgi:hypothetical protein